MDFNDMTADQIRDYKGPVFRAKVVASRTFFGQPESHDFDSTTFEYLNTKIDRLAKTHRIRSITYGPHTADQGRVLIEDANPMAAMGL
jgi:hypothetical protein